MKRFIVELSDEWDTGRLHKLFYEVDTFPERIYPVKEDWERADGEARMTTAQRDRLWEMCGNYNVPFREDDYHPTIFSGDGPIMYEGWIGNQDGTPFTPPGKKTIYVGVEPNGDSHT